MFSTAYVEEYRGFSCDHRGVPGFRGCMWSGWAEAYQIQEYRTPPNRVR